jgi:hypothetical protein
VRKQTPTGLGRGRIRLPKNFTPTHQTGGLPGFPAIDVFAREGTTVYPPEGGVIVYKHFIPWNHVARVGGWTCYLQGNSGDTYFLTHFALCRREGRVHLWQAIGFVGAVPDGWWPSHIHEGKHKGVYTP